MINDGEWANLTWRKEGVDMVVCYADGSRETRWIPEDMDKDMFVYHYPLIRQFDRGGKQAMQLVFVRKGSCDILPPPNWP